MREWEEKELGSILEALIDYRGKTPKKSGAGIPLVTAKVIKNGRILPPNEFLTTDEYDRWMTRGFPKKGDMVLTMEAPLGEVAIIEELPIALAQRTVAMRANDGHSTRFLKYFLQSRFGQHELKIRASGTTVQGIKSSLLKKVPIPSPPKNEQEAIAEVLSSLDDKINLLKSQNKTLEGMSEALFRQWFLEESQDDWEQVSLDELFEVNPKESIAKSSLTPFVEMKNLEEFSSTIGDWRFREFTSGSKFRNGDTLFARITPCLENGKIGLVRSLPTNAVGWGSTEFIVLRPRLGISPLLGFALGINPEFRELAISSMTGSSGRQRARTEVLHNFTLFMPPASILDEINTTIDALESRISKNQAEIKNVTAQRDTLLPKLMSGEVRVQNIPTDEN